MGFSVLSPFPWRGGGAAGRGVLLLCVVLVAVLRSEPVWSAAPPSMEMVTMEVALGETAILPCNGSAYLAEGAGPGGEEEGEEDEGGLFLWEAMGTDVAAFKDGAMVEGYQYEGRVRLAPEDRLREGNWSLVLEGAKHSDANMYECIVPGRRTVSNVWLKVNGPPEVQALRLNAWLGDRTHLVCKAPDHELAAPDLDLWFERDGVVVPHSEEDEERLHVATDGNYVDLFISQVLISDHGVYHCFYKTSPSSESRRGSPEIRLTVLGSEPTENETTTETTTETTAMENMTPGTAAAPTPATAPQEDASASATAAARPDPTPLPSDDPPGGQETIQSEKLPWVRISLISGVLAFTGTTLCILGARHMI